MPGSEAQGRPEALSTNAWAGGCGRGAGNGRDDGRAFAGWDGFGLGRAGRTGITYGLVLRCHRGYFWCQ